MDMTVTHLLQLRIPTIMEPVTLLVEDIALVQMPMTVMDVVLIHTLTTGEAVFVTLTSSELIVVILMYMMSLMAIATTPVKETVTDLKSGTVMDA
jgi:hypothetical protein